jgi:hypothetical protein
MSRPAPEFTGILRRNIIRMPEAIRSATGIIVLGKRIKSLLFTTDVALIRNHNADAVIAVYPFTPQPIINHSLILAADVPIFCGIGGGATTGRRCIDIARDAEFHGALGVVVNAPASDRLVARLKRLLEIPVIVTVVWEHEDIRARLDAGADILNISGAGNTTAIVRRIRELDREIPVIATGGRTDEEILETVAAGANAITYTPPTPGELFRGVMQRYREAKRQEGGGAE